MGLFSMNYSSFYFLFQTKAALKSCYYRYAFDNEWTTKRDWKLKTMTT